MRATMPRSLLYFIGPELVWVLVYLLTGWLISRNQPPTDAGRQQLELYGYFLPTLGVLLSLAVLAWAPGNQWLWLLRIFVVCAVAIVYVVGHLCTNIDYGDSRNSGVGTAFMLFIGLGYMALLGGSFIAAIVILIRSRMHSA